MIKFLNKFSQIMGNDQKKNVITSEMFSNLINLINIK